jgi:hypothetical protein
MAVLVFWMIRERNHSTGIHVERHFSWASTLNVHQSASYSLWVDGHEYPHLVGQGRRYLRIAPLNVILFYQAPTWSQGGQKMVLKYMDGRSDVVFPDPGSLFIDFGADGTVLVSADHEKVIVNYDHERWEFNVPAAACTQIS